MKWFSVFLSALLLASCSSKPKPSPYRQFFDTHFFFDMQDEVERVSCPIIGTIPSWLSGTLLRNGPAKFEVDGKRTDWFDGLSMLHAFEFSPNQVLYTNRFLRSEQYYIMMKEKSLNFVGFAQDPCSRVFKNRISAFMPKEMQGIQNANISIQQYADRMAALTEGPLPVLFDPVTLATLGPLQYQDQLPAGQWQSAHSLYDPLQNETVSYYVRFGKESSYIIWKMKDGALEREQIAEIPVSRPSYMHSFALTEHYVVLVEYPFVVNPLRFKFFSKPFIFNYKWEPKRGTNWIVVHRSTGAVTRIKGDPFFSFHHVNAFEKEGKIILDIVTYRDPSIIDFLAGRIADSQEEILKAEKNKMERFTLSLAGQTLVRETILEEECEMPRVPASRVAQEYRYAYLIDPSFPFSIDESRAIYKVDTETKSFLAWSHAGCFPGEPIFVPNPNSSKEDDGVVLSVILDFAASRSFLLVLDAKTMKEVARASAPHPIPMGLHGLWAPS